MTINFELDLDLDSVAEAIGMKIEGDRVISKSGISLEAFRSVVSEYIKESLEGGTNSNAVLESLYVNDDEQDVLREMVEDYEEEHV